MKALSTPTPPHRRGTAESERPRCAECDAEIRDDNSCDCPPRVATPTKPAAYVLEAWGHGYAARAVAECEDDSSFARDRVTLICDAFLERVPWHCRAFSSWFRRKTRLGQRTYARVEGSDVWGRDHGNGLWDMRDLYKVGAGYRYGHSFIQSGGTVSKRGSHSDRKRARESLGVVGDVLALVAQPLSRAS